MLKLNLASEPYWLDLGHGVRLLVEPLTTAVMIAARNDPAVAEAADNGASQDDLARLVAKSIARIVVRDWEGVGDADGQRLPVTPEGLNAPQTLTGWQVWDLVQRLGANCALPAALVAVPCSAGT